MPHAKRDDKLRIRTADELARQMGGLIELSEILNETLERWFLSGGTLLGAYRDGDFIPWDWDVEVTLFTEEAREKEGSLLKGLLARGFLITSSDSSWDNFKIVASGWGTDYELMGRYLNRSDDLRARVMTEVPARFFETPETVSFRGHNFPAPGPVEDFLEALYGDWKTPLRTKDKERYLSAESYRGATAGSTTRLPQHLSLLLAPAQVREVPPVQEASVDRFQSWDRELGWCNQPNRTRVDQSDRSLSGARKDPSGLALFSTDEKSSRRCAYPSGRSEVGVFGDGYGMCRDVDDEQTFAWYLGELRRTRVANYAVADYGLDQALLRLRREYPRDPSEVIVLTATSTTMARCVSVFNHYLEPGNVLAIKPRFRIAEEDETLTEVAYPLQSRKDLFNLSEYRGFFRAHDEHFCLWRRGRVDYYFRQMPRRVTARLGLGKSPVGLSTFEYEIGFWRSHEMLFFGMMAMFQELADYHGFRPIFLLQHDRRSLEYLAGKSAEQLPWTSAMEKGAQKFPELTFLDEADLFSGFENSAKIYTRFHHSPEANRMIADYLNRHL